MAKINPCRVCGGECWLLTLGDKIFGFTSAVHHGHLFSTCTGYTAESYHNRDRKIAESEAITAHNLRNPLPEEAQNG